METPRDDRVHPSSLCYGYGSPPMFGRSRSYAETQQPTPGDADMQDVVTQIGGMQLEDAKAADFRLPFQSSDGDELPTQAPRLPFQSFAFNRRGSRPCDANCFLPSPPMHLHGNTTLENLKPGVIHQRPRERSNSFLVHDAPRLPASPELDSSERDVTRPGGFLPPPIFSPLYKYSTVNTNALVRDDISANDTAFMSYLNANTHASSRPGPQCPPTPVHAPAPPSMPMIGTPTPPVDRKLLKMRKGYDLALHTPQFSSYQHQFMTPS